MAGTNRSVERQRGFSLIEALVVVGLMSGVLLAVAAMRGTRPPAAHVAALGLQAALAEARSLAMSNADVTASGATVSVEPERGGTVVTVYESRPIAGRTPPELDAGFPPQHYGASMTLGGAAAAGQPFAIFVSSSGYASVAANYAYDSAHPVLLSADPGCDEAAGVAITISDGIRSETHALDCRETQYEAQPSPRAGSTG
jgi:type II secretory pathway pseudopilin PulG